MRKTQVHYNINPLMYYRISKKKMKEILGSNVLEGILA